MGKTPMSMAPGEKFEMFSKNISSITPAIARSYGGYLHM